MKLLLSFVIGFNYFEIPDEMITEDDEIENTSRSLSTKNDESLDIREVMEDENIVKPKQYLKQICKIQYDLPKSSKNITVVYLGTCARITLDSTSIVVKCKIIGLTSFISFTVLHQIDTSDINAPVILKHHDIHFQFKGEWVNDNDNESVEGRGGKSFYFFPEKDEGSYGYLLEIIKGQIPEKVETQYLKVDSKNYLLRTTCKFHRKNTKIQIQNAAEELAKIFQTMNVQEIESKISETDTRNMSEKTKTKEPNKSYVKDLTNKNTIPTISLTLTGNQLLFEKSLWKMGQVNSSANILYGGLIATSTEVLTEEQRSYYKTLSVNIKSIDNLPPSLTNHGIQTISIEYSLPPLNISEVIQPTELEKGFKIKFNDYKTFFNNEHKDEIIIETIQSTPLKVTVYGQREKIIVEPESRVWGQHLSCNKFCKRFDKSIDAKDIAQANKYITNERKNNTNKLSKNPKKSKKAVSKKSLSDKDLPEIENVVIGFAFIGLYSLMQYCHKIIKNAALHSTNQAHFREDFKMSIRPMNAMHFHNSYNSDQKGIISEKELTDCMTTIKVELKLGYNLTRYVLNDVLTIPTLFARCVIIDYEPKESYKFLKELLQLNKLTLDKAKNVPFNCYQNLGLVPDICSDKVPTTTNYENDEATYKIDKNTNNELDISTNNQNYFTGFMVNAINYCIIVLECLDIQAISKIMVHRYKMLQEKGRILYNSNFVFNERLYDDFLKFGGVFVTALGVPLDSVFSHSQIAHWTPRPALKCIEILKRITNAKYIRQSLFPTPLELLSMDLEFGVPMHRTDVIYN